MEIPMKPSAFTQNDNVRLTPQDLNGRDWEGGRARTDEWKETVRPSKTCASVWREEAGGGEKSQLFAQTLGRVQSNHTAIQSKAGGFELWNKQWLQNVLIWGDGLRFSQKTLPVEAFSFFFFSVQRPNRSFSFSAERWRITPQQSHTWMPAEFFANWVEKTQRWG